MARRGAGPCSIAAGGHGICHAEQVRRAVGSPTRQKKDGWFLATRPHDSDPRKSPLLASRDRRFDRAVAIKRARNVGEFVRPQTWARFAKLINFFRYDGAERSAITMGNEVHFSPTVSVRNGSRITVHDGAHIGQWCYLWAGDSHGRIEVGACALFGPGVFITASDYDFDAGDGPVWALPKRERDVHIGANTWLGANVVVVAGVTIGDGAIVAAGSVVTKDLPSGSVAAGVPARVIRQRGRRSASTSEQR